MKKKKVNDSPQYITIKLTRLQAEAVYELLHAGLQPPANPVGFFSSEMKWLKAAWQVYFKLAGILQEPPPTP